MRLILEAGAREDDPGPCFEATSIMAAMAAETKNVRVGVLVLCMGYRNPSVLAKSAITIDHLSNGRLELGLGAGWNEMEYTAYGIPLPSRGDKNGDAGRGDTDRQVHADTNGDHLHREALPGGAGPQRPAPGPGEAQGLDRRQWRTSYPAHSGARYADGWNMGSDGGTVEDYKRKIQVLDRWCETESRDPAEIERSVVVAFYMGSDAADARRKTSTFSEEWHRRSQIGGLFGTPREAVDIIGEYVDAGAQGV